MNLLDALTKWANAWHRIENRWHELPYPQDVRDELQYRLLIKRQAPQELVITLPNGSAGLIEDAIQWVKWEEPKLDTTTLQYALDSNGEGVKVITMPNLVIWLVIYRLDWCVSVNEIDASENEQPYNKASDFYFVVWSAITNQLKAIELS